MELNKFKNTADNDCDVFLTEKQLASRWKVSHQKLANDRWHRIGCPYVKLGRSIRYRIQDVEAYESYCLVNTKPGAVNASGN